VKRWAADWGAAIGMMVALWAGLFVLTLPHGCARVQTPEGTILVLPEAPGAFAQEMIGGKTGVTPGAVTLPIEGVPPIYFDPETAADPCAREHEAVHTRQLAREPIPLVKLRYGSELATCLHAVPPAERRAAFNQCYRNVSYEREAYAAQAACKAARADGGSQP
jgi:hypothetical protein